MGSRIAHCLDQMRRLSARRAHPGQVNVATWGVRWGSASGQSTRPPGIPLTPNHARRGVVVGVEGICPIAQMAC